MLSPEDGLLLEQGSDEWLEAKLGIFGGTTFDKVQAVGTQTYKSLIYEKVAQRLLLAHQNAFSSRHTDWGLDHENVARLRYTMQTGRTVQLAGLVASTFSPWVAVSPDGLVGPDGGIEIKCPSTSREHIRHLVEGAPKVYVAQMQGCMLVTGRNWWDFVSFDPRMDSRPETIMATTHIQRYERDEQYIANLKLCLEQAVADVEKIISQIT